MSSDPGSDRPAAAGPETAAPSRPLVVGFAGMAGSGKSTLARLVAEHLSSPPAVVRSVVEPVRAEVLSIAAPIREACKHLGIDKRDDPELFRAVAVAMGMAARRVKPGFWLEHLADDVAAAGADGARVVLVDDVRFTNEAAFCDQVVYVLPDGPGFPRLSNEAESLAVDLYRQFKSLGFEHNTGLRTYAFTPGGWTLEPWRVVIRRDGHQDVAAAAVTGLVRSLLAAPRPRRDVF